VEEQDWYRVLGARSGSMPHGSRLPCHVINRIVISPLRWGLDRRTRGRRHRMPRADCKTREPAGMRTGLYLPNSARRAIRPRWCPSSAGTAEDLNGAPIAHGKEQTFASSPSATSSTLERDSLASD
jgi:hypothetical protein